MKPSRRTVETEALADPACSPFALVSLVAPFAIARGAPVGRSALQRHSDGKVRVAGDALGGLESSSLGAPAPSAGR